MAEIAREESWRQIRLLTDRAEQAMADGQPNEAVDRWRAVLAHPCAHHQVAADEILDEIHRAYREAGRYADALFATLRARDPEDVWLYNSAASSYVGIDVAASRRWALDGIEVALSTGDPDQVVLQLPELTEDAWGRWLNPSTSSSAGGWNDSATSGHPSPSGARGVRRRPWRTDRAPTAAPRAGPARHRLVPRRPVARGVCTLAGPAR
ncbi:MAG: hypothetical protein EA387_12340 [Nitriliruptor sp.]|nr:MAG: hypothetical protein EA387_12340 [Nitriliruptor sp.]